MQVLLVDTEAIQLPAFKLLKCTVLQFCSTTFQGNYLQYPTNAPRYTTVCDLLPSGQSPWYCAPPSQKTQYLWNDLSTPRECSPHTRSKLLQLRDNSIEIQSEHSELKDMERMLDCLCLMNKE